MARFATNRAIFLSYCNTLVYDYLKAQRVLLIPSYKR